MKLPENIGAIIATFIGALASILDLFGQADLAAKVLELGDKIPVIY